MNKILILIKNSKILWGIVMLPILLASCNREVELSFEDWDKNNDNLIELTEFQRVFTTNYYDDWNSKDDDYLDDEDFYAVIYDLWDENRDGELSFEEYSQGYEYYFAGKHVGVDYVTVDADGNGIVVYEEYSDAFTETDFYNEWDLDVNSSLNQTEIASGLFSVWDVDESGYLEPDEYKKFDQFYPDI